MTLLRIVFAYKGKIFGKIIEKSNFSSSTQIGCVKVLYFCIWKKKKGIK